MKYRIACFLLATEIAYPQVQPSFEVASIAMGVPEGFGAPPPDWPGPTLFTALEEQLGLKLESQKGPVEMFTIERIEKPRKINRSRFHSPLCSSHRRARSPAPNV